MATGFIRNSDLPFVADAAIACAAARAGTANIRVPGLPSAIELLFIGTGTATMPPAANHIFEVDSQSRNIDIRWISNKFVGKHWLLGDFSIDLVDGAPSTGRLIMSDDSESSSNVINENMFFFDFRFDRFPVLNMRNVVPIVNKATVSAIPPIGSVFELDSEARAIGFVRGNSNIAQTPDTPNLKLVFDRCSITVFPVQNAELQLVSKTRHVSSYNVEVRLRNPTASKATFAYFNVLHFDGLQPSQDYGFLTLDTGSEAIISFSLASTIPNRDVDVPFFVGLYTPQKLQGSASITVPYSY